MNQQLCANSPSLPGTGLGCCCDHSGLGALARFYGLGALRLDSTWPGDRFVFEFENSYRSGPVGLDYSQIATFLEDSGISYSTRSYVLSGSLNPYIRVEGASNVYWDSASDLKDEIYSLISSAGWAINSASIKFSAETHSDGQAPAVSSSDSVPGGGDPNAPGKSKCDWSRLPFSEALACALGITKTNAMVIGAVGALLAVVVISKAAR